MRNEEEDEKAKDHVAETFQEAAALRRQLNQRREAPSLSRRDRAKRADVEARVEWELRIRDNGKKPRGLRPAYLRSGTEWNSPWRSLRTLLFLARHGRLPPTREEVLSRISYPADVFGEDT